MKQYTLSNGFSICLVPVTHAKIISMKLVVRTGIAYENPNTLGYSHLLEHILLDSNPKHLGLKGIEELESRGIQINASTGKNYVDYIYTGSTSNWKKIFDSLSGSLLNPKFTKKTFDREKHAVIEELKIHLDSPLKKYKDEILEKLYPKSIIASKITDILESTNKCTMKKFKQFFKEQYAPINSTLLVVGKFPMQQLMQKIKILENFETSDTFRGTECPHITLGKFPQEAYIKTPKVTKAYCNIIFNLDIKPYSKEFYIAHVLEYILTEGFMSVLFKKLRLEKKWIYNMDSTTDVTCFSSDFSLSFNTDRKNLPKCLREIFIQIDKLRKNGISKKLLNMTRMKIKTEWDRTATNNIISELCNHYQELIIADVPKISLDMYYKKLIKINASDLKTFINQYLDKDNSCIFYGSSKNPFARCKSRKTT